jgi:predicted dehydrogenase
MSHDGISRRYFFFGTLLAGAVPRGGFGSTQSLKALGYKSPNEKLNIAGIGAGGRPYADLVASEAGVENIVALTDVDFERGAQGFTRWPKAEKYRDFRQMLDKHGKHIDAVVIGTADHMHATCALACMQAGKHVYVEKPLTRTAWEARLLTQAAEKYKVATQMGNQGYSHDATRVACEILWSGEIGEVREVHAWHGGPGWPQGMQKIPPPTPVPSSLDWDLWLGGAAWRPYTAGDEEYRAYVSTVMGGRGGGGGGRGAGRGAAEPGATPAAPATPPAAPPEFGFYLPFNWRGFHDFGSGLFGDWGVHIMGPANWGLQLSPESLVSVERVKAEGISPFTYPVKNAVKYDFAARGNMPPVTVYWTDSVQGDAYLPPGMTAEQARKIAGAGPQVGPAGRGGGGGRGGAGGTVSSGYNLIFAGSKGYLGTSGRGEGVGLLPGTRWAEYKLPNPYLQRSPGASTGDNGSAHARDWVRACKGGAPACSNFSVAGPYTEWLVLGAVATHYEGKLMWDHAKGEISNNREANKWVKPAFRKGWEFKL